jgi:hypothetical protein
MIYIYSTYILTKNVNFILNFINLKQNVNIELNAHIEKGEYMNVNTKIYNKNLTL